MQMKLSNRVWGIFGIVSTISIASAHPGHAPTDLTAQVSQPFAGPDHLVVFIALSVVLLTVLRGLAKARAIRSSKAQIPNSK